jgi:hypothetical protein
MQDAALTAELGASEVFERLANLKDSHRVDLGAETGRLVERQ